MIQYVTGNGIETLPDAEARSRGLGENEQVSLRASSAEENVNTQQGAITVAVQQHRRATEKLAKDQPETRAAAEFERKDAVRTLERCRLQLVAALEELTTYAWYVRTPVQVAQINERLRDARDDLTAHPDGDPDTTPSSVKITYVLDGHLVDLPRTEATRLKSPHAGPFSGLGLKFADRLAYHRVRAETARDQALREAEQKKQLIDSLEAEIATETDRVRLQSLRAKAAHVRQGIASVQADAASHENALARLDALPPPEATLTSEQFDQGLPPKS